jgi:hypothetical protein
MRLAVRVPHDRYTRRLESVRLCKMSVALQFRDGAVV